MENRRLISKRKEKNLTQEQLGVVAGVSQAMISLAEKGERSLEDEKKIHVAKALGVSVEWLFFDEKYNKL